MEVREVETLMIASNSEPGKEYAVTLFSNSYVRCPCFGFLYRGYCSHVRQFAEQVAARSYSVMALKRLREQADRLRSIAAAVPANLDQAADVWALVGDVEERLNSYEAERRNKVKAG